MEVTSCRKRKRSCSMGTNKDNCSELVSKESGSSSTAVVNKFNGTVAPDVGSFHRGVVVSDSLNVANSAELYRILGQEDFLPLKKQSVTSKWVAAGTTFPAELSKKNQLKLKHLHGLHPRLMEIVENNIKRWFPVQKAVLPSLIRSANCLRLLPPRDLAISAPTGSGKTLCYLIPIINSLSCWVSSLGVYALIVAPVQTLVVQIEKEFNRFNCFNIPTAVLSGSNDIITEKRQLETAVVVFATPGRLAEHLFGCGSNLNLSNLKYLVVDEADRLHHVARLEWLEAVELASGATKSSNSIEDFYHGSYLQKILVSATLSHDVENLYIWRLRHPHLFRATKSATSEAGEEIDQEFISDLGSAILPSSLMHRTIICDSTVKPLTVYSEIIGHPEWKKILVFVDNTLTSQRLTVLLKFLGRGTFNVEELSSNLFGRRRFKVLNRFKQGVTKVLISSDVLSRGVDVEDIDVIFNYGKPKNGRHFIHRAGRTARCGKKGVAISVVTAQEKKELEDLLRSIAALDTSAATSFEVSENDPLFEQYRTALELLKGTLEIKRKKL